MAGSSPANLIRQDMIGYTLELRQNSVAVRGYTFFGDTMITVYVDVLVSLNWFVNFFLLLAVSKIGKTPLKFFRNLSASFVLAVSSLTIFLPPLSAVVECGLRIGFAGVGVFIAFGFRSVRTFLKNTGMLFAAAFAYGGIMLGLWYVFHPQTLVIHNGVTYFDVSPIGLIVFTLISYGVLWLLRKNFAKEPTFTPFVTLHIQKENKTITLQAKVDTGLTLEDIYSNHPLILFSPKLSQTLGLISKESFRLLPFETVNGAGLLKSVVVEGVTVCYEGVRVTFPKTCGVLGEQEFHSSFDALVGYDFIERMKREYEDSSNSVANHSGGVLQKKNRLYQRFGNLAAPVKTGRGNAVDGTAEKG